MQSERTLPQLEAELIRGYEAQVAEYSRFWTSMESLPRDFDASSNADGTLQNMSAVMDAIARIDVQLAPIRQEWLDRRTNTSAELAAIIGKVENWILKLMQRINEAERRATEARARMTPQLSAETVSRKMRMAYASARENT